MSHPNQARSPAARTVTYRPERNGLWFVLAVPVLLIGMWVISAKQRKYGLSGFPPVEDLIILFFGVLLFAWEWAKRIFITRSIDGKILYIEQRGLFSRTCHTVHSAPDIQDVSVEQDLMGEGSTHRVVLVQRDNTRVPVTDRFHGGGRHHERAAREIRALLQPPNQDAAVTTLKAPL